MNIVTEEIIKNLINILDFKDTDSEKLEDAHLRNYLKYARVLELERTNILKTHNTLNSDDLYYSRYYWFIMFKNRYFDLYGHDEGLEQQASKMLEDIAVNLDNGINWPIIECIDKGALI